MTATPKIHVGLVVSHLQRHWQLLVNNPGNGPPRYDQKSVKICVKTQQTNNKLFLGIIFPKRDLKEVK